MFDGLLRFQISEKWANLWFPLNIQKKKVFQLQGGFAPLTPRPGALPLDPAGGSAPRPRYRLALQALAMPPPLLNPKYATGWSHDAYISHMLKGVRKSKVGRIFSRSGGGLNTNTKQK